MEGTMAKGTVRLGAVDAIPLGEGRAFVVDGEPIAVFRTRAGGLFATQAFCPHARGPLADGLIGNATVLCPLHAFAFDLTSGRCLNGRCPDLGTYAVSAGSGGEILLHVSPSEEGGRGVSMSEGTAA
jgi:nitrite reductase (NADH) small subunit